MNNLYLIITYDIEEDRTRQKVSEALLNAGLLRVQKSVFEGEIAPKSLEKLQKRLGKLVGKADSIRYYRLCGKCRWDVTVQGRDDFPERKAVTIV